MRRLIVISGAGFSAESGVRTFRTDTTSGRPLWDEYDLEEVCNIHAFNKGFDHKDDQDPPSDSLSKMPNSFGENLYKLTNEFYNKRREELVTVEPNLAHLRVAEWYKRYPAGKVINMTTNVDDLLERAGIPCEDVLHIHGFLREVVTLDTNRNKRITDVGYTSVDTEAMEWVKPNVVFFGELAPAYTKMYDILDTLTSNDMVIVVGCSNVVINFNWELFPAVRRGTKVLVVNPQINYLEEEQYSLNGVIQFRCGAVEAFGNPHFINLVEDHLEGK